MVAGQKVQRTRGRPGLAVEAPPEGRDLSRCRGRRIIKAIQVGRDDTVIQAEDHADSLRWLERAVVCVEQLVAVLNVANEAQRWASVALTQGRNQAAAAVAQQATGSGVQQILSALSFSSHVSNLSGGIIDIQDVAFFLSWS